LQKKLDARLEAPYVGGERGGAANGAAPQAQKKDAPPSWILERRQGQNGDVCPVRLKDSMNRKPVFVKGV